MNRVHPFDYRVITTFLTSLNCPRALSVLILLKYGEFDQIVSLGFKPQDYDSVESARDALQATELLRKHADLPTSIDRATVAYESFCSAEQHCKATNDRLLANNSRASLLFAVSRKIADVLSDFDFEEFVESSGWGPGSTLFIKRSRASAAAKFRQKHEFSPTLLGPGQKWIRAAFPEWHLKPVVSDYNKVITVPKNAKTDRTIAVEPSLNLFFQKGAGAMIRRRLARFGVDLNDQTVNQKRAQHGSLDNSLATVDFSAASDTISSILVLELLPQKWFNLLDLLRSRRGYHINKRVLIEYEKFSSMGNGYTFELESLIFWAVAKATVPVDHPQYSLITVFGDDVIIPSDYYDAFADACSFLGFTINPTKSFADSPYRESCGKHYWNGVDITPIYLRRTLTPVEAMRFHNRVVELSRRTIGAGFRDKRFQPCINLLWNSRSKELTDAVIPVGYGDLGYIRDLDQVRPTFNRKLHRGWFSLCYLESSGHLEEDDDSFLLSKLYHQWKQGDQISEVSLGNKVTYALHRKHRLKKLWFPDWPLLGPWI